MSSTLEAVLEGIVRARRKVRRRTTVGENLYHLRGGPRKNFFNNRGLISGAIAEAILPTNFGAVRRGNTGQEGRIDVTSHDGILDAVGAKGPETVDGGAVELVAETVEVAHADLAGASQVAAVMATALLETGLRYYRRYPRRLRRSIPPLSR